MSFFKNLADKFDDLSVGGRKDEQQTPQAQQHGRYNVGDSYSASNSSPPQQQYGQYGSQYGQGQYSYPAPQQYNFPAQGELYSSTPAQQRYGGQSQAPEYPPPQDKPPIPRGWISKWDQRYQHWYYVEEATGRSQWEAPGFDATRPPMPGADSRAHQPSYGGGVLPPNGYGASGHGDGCGGYVGEQRGDSYEPEKEKNSSNKSGMLLGVAGGLAVGAVGGALLNEALDDSSDDDHQAPLPAPVYVVEAASTPVYAESPREYYAPPPGDESDRESFEEAREDYIEALEDAASSSASSSEREELEEAREEYREKYEEYYGEDD
ncbi:hypothetical protein G7054_g6518 [Neopestalotiopsis clavispora]|nr:hypothetical protein G7054_g6518 [Neopestalotiopsis clavispora]